MSEYTVGTVDELPPGESLGVEVDGLEIAVFNIDGDFYAISNRCPHKSGSLCEAGDAKFNAEDCTTPTRGDVNTDSAVIHCPLHWWEFDLKTGKNPTSNMQVRTFDVNVEDEKIRVSV